MMAQTKSKIVILNGASSAGNKLWLQECLRCMLPYDAYFIGVYCDDRVLSHREILRGDRFPGWGRGSQKWVHEHLTYDMIIDTSIHNCEDSARKIVLAIENGQEPEAANKMRKQWQIE